MHQFLTVAMTSRSAAKLKAVDQARSKLEELAKYDYPCFTFMLTEEGPELLGEEDLTTELMEIFEERGLIEMAQRIKLRGQALYSSKYKKHEDTANAGGVFLSPSTSSSPPPRAPRL